MMTDSRKPFVLGLISLAALMVGGIIFAVRYAGPSSSSGTYDANVSFVDDGDPTYGPTDAPITIRMFEDFECSACRVAKTGVDYVKQTYGDKVRFVWNDVPLPMHQYARLAANAGRCAEEQGKFWEYGDLVYQEQPYWSQSKNASDAQTLFIRYAEQIGLNKDSFTTCFDDRRYDAKIIADSKEAQANKVDATPTFFVNQKRYVGVMSNVQWDAAIKEATQK